MPSVDKAIINPFEPLDVGEALLVAVSGLLVVFVMLAMLMAVILVISKIVGAIEGKGKAPAAPAPKSAAPAAKPAAAPAAPAVDEGELVAVMMAAVAEESGMSPTPSRSPTSVRLLPPLPPAPVAAPAAAPRTCSRCRPRACCGSCRCGRRRDGRQQPHARKHLQGGVLCGPGCKGRRCAGGAGGHEDGNRGLRSRRRNCEGRLCRCGYCCEHR